MPKIDIDNHNLMRFPSLAAFVDYVNSPCDMRDDERESITGRKSFTGSESFEAAAALAFRWDEGAEAVTQMRAKMNVGVERIKKENRASYNAPGSLNMAKVIKGEPRPYVRRVDTEERIKGSGSVVRIVANISASANVDTAVMQRRGAAVMSLVENLEKKRRRCEVVVVFKCTGGNHSTEYRVMVKGAAQKLNLPSIAYAMSHPSMLRRHVFAAMEHEHPDMRKALSVPGWYGTPADTEDTKRKGIIYLPRMYGSEPQWRNEETCAAWVMDELRRQGVIK